MKTSTTCLLTLVTITVLMYATSTVYAPNPGKCGVAPFARQPCGNESTDERCCVVKYKCCWENIGSPRCYHRRPNLECVNVIPPKRVSCGPTVMYNPPSEEQCLQNDDCCYDNSIKDTSKWCYHKAGCSVAPGERLPCGVSYIPSKYCTSRGCCYDKLSTPCCFLKGPST